MKKMLLVVPLVLAVVVNVHAERRMLFAAQPENEFSTFIQVSNNTDINYLFQACEGGNKKNCGVQVLVAAGAKVRLSVPDRKVKHGTERVLKNIESYQVKIFDEQGRDVALLKNVKVGSGFTLKPSLAMVNSTETTFIMKDSQSKAISWANPQ